MNRCTYIWIFVFISLALFIPGCGWPPNYGFYGEEYHLTHVLINISDSTLTNLDYEYSELEIYDVDIPGSNVPSQEGLCSWVKDPYSMVLACEYAIRGLPKEKTFYATAKTYHQDGTIGYSEVPDWYSPYGHWDWRIDVFEIHFSRDIYGDLTEYFTQTFTKRINKGENHEFSLVNLPLETTSLSLINEFGDYYILKLNRVLFPSENDHIYGEVYLSENYNMLYEYINENLVCIIPFSAGYSYMIPYQFYPDQFGCGNEIDVGSTYSFELLLRTSLKIWNEITINGSILVNRSDYEIPYIDFYEAEPYFNENEVKIIRFGIKYFNETQFQPNAIKIYYKKENSDWIREWATFEGEAYHIYLQPSQLQDTKNISIRVELRKNQNNITYTIEPIAIKQRAIRNIDYYTGWDNYYNGYYISGDCIDSESEDCSQLSFDLYLNNTYLSPLSLKRTFLGDINESDLDDLRVVWRGDLSSAYPYPHPPIYRGRWSECNTEIHPKTCYDVCSDLETVCVEKCTTISGVENRGAEVFYNVNDCSLDYSYESGCANTIPSGSSRHCCCGELAQAPGPPGGGGEGGKHPLYEEIPRGSPQPTQEALFNKILNTIKNIFTTKIQ